MTDQKTPTCPLGCSGEVDSMQHHEDDNRWMFECVECGVNWESPNTNRWVIRIRALETKLAEAKNKRDKWAKAWKKAAVKWWVAHEISHDCRLIAEQRARDAEQQFHDKTNETLEMTRAEIARMNTLIDDTAKHWMTIEGIPWEGAIDAAMEAAVKEIARLKTRLEKYEQV